jgi:predicted RNA-binding Zn-ribbon protein involved in translation (DUF1610 family)
MMTGKHSLTAVKVWCATCDWRGERIPREGSARYGACPRCGAAVIAATALADRRVAKAKAELAELDGR